MASHQSHRGPASKDRTLFSEDQLPALRAAARDLCWLLDRGYAPNSSIQLVGNRYNLTSRQRMAVSRCSCSREEADRRRKSEVSARHVEDRELWLDGYNVLTVLESALGGGVVLPGRDGCCRDIAGIHRRYRKVNETIPALQMIGETASAWGVARCRWLLDKPVSNSGRLKTLILYLAARMGWDVSVELVFNPDRALWESGAVIATSDGEVLDRCARWVNLAGEIILNRISQVRMVDLFVDGEG